MASTDEELDELGPEESTMVVSGEKRKFPTEKSCALQDRSARTKP
jgi:hypothetical protein